MRSKRDAVRSEGGSHVRMSGKDRAHDVDLAEHRRCEEVEARAVFEEQFGDIAAPHVCGCAERALPVAAAPVPGGVDELRLRTECVADRIDVAMRVADERLHELGLERCGR